MSFGNLIDLKNLKIVLCPFSPNLFLTIKLKRYSSLILLITQGFGPKTKIVSSNDNFSM